MPEFAGIPPQTLGTNGAGPDALPPIRVEEMAASASPELGRFFLAVQAELGHSPFQNSWLLKLNLMVSADCDPTFGLVRGRPRHVCLQGGLSSPPELGPFLFSGR
jgi:hypothetical protein